MQLIGKNISAERGGEIVFSAVNFLLGENQMLTISGPNGAGKSTLLRIIAGLLPPFYGSVQFFDGSHFFKVPPYAHYLGEQNAMKPFLSVGDNLKFWVTFYQPSKRLSPSIKSLIEGALTKIGLAHSIDLPFGVLSSGQKRRIALCRLLLHHQPLWILDEPTTGLDTEACAIFAQIMQDHLDRKGMIIAATHLPLGVHSTHNIVLNPLNLFLEETA